MRFFGIVAALLMMAGLVLGVPVVAELFDTGLVSRLPTAPLAVALVILSFLSLTCGLVIDSVTKSGRHPWELWAIREDWRGCEGRGVACELGVLTSMRSRLSARFLSPAIITGCFLGTLTILPFPRLLLGRSSPAVCPYSFFERPTAIAERPKCGWLCTSCCQAHGTLFVLGRGILAD